MLDIGIFAPFGKDHERNIAFCWDTNVAHIVLSTGQVAAGAGEVPAAASLKEVVSVYAAAGIQLTALTPPRIRQQAFADSAIQSEEAAFMGALFANMGEADIPLVHMYLNVDPVEDDGREALWAGLVEVYGQLVPLAEKAGVRISAHHFHLPTRLLWNYETMSRLLDEVGGSGVTYCQGKSQLAGDDLVSDIRNYEDRIFMFHVRDIVTRAPAGASDEVEKRLADLGYLEVALGTGEVDMVGSFRALKAIDYAGQIYPEHFPAIAGDHAAGLAWTIGYMRALDQAVEV